MSPTPLARTSGVLFQVMPPASGATAPCLDARLYSTTGVHAGSSADPWPGKAIVNAINALPQPTGGCVDVASGIWLVDSFLDINVDNWILEGTSTSASQIWFASTGNLQNQIWIGSSGGGTRGVDNCTIKNLILDARSLSSASNFGAVRISNGSDFTFTNIQSYFHPNSNVPAVFFEGGDGVTISSNRFIGDTFVGGDSCLQIQTGPGTGKGNINFTISNNTISDTDLVTIGLSNCLIQNNTLTTGFGVVGIKMCGTDSTACHDVTATNNIVNCGGVNGAYLGGLPNDPGLGSQIYNFTITNNTVTGTQAFIAAQSLDAGNYINGNLLNNIKTNVTISGNILNNTNAGSRPAISLGGGTSAPGVDGGYVINGYVTNNTFNGPGLAPAYQTDTHTLTSSACGNTDNIGGGTPSSAFAPC